MVNYVANERHYPCNHRDVKINKYPLKVGPMRSEYEADTGEAKAPWQRPCRCVEGELLHVYTGDARREWEERSDDLASGYSLLGAASNDKRTRTW